MARSRVWRLVEVGVFVLGVVFAVAVGEVRAEAVPATGSGLIAAASEERTDVDVLRDIDEAWLVVQQYRPSSPGSIPDAPLETVDAVLANFLDQVAGLREELGHSRPDSVSEEYYRDEIDRVRADLDSLTEAANNLRAAIAGGDMAKIQAASDALFIKGLSWGSAAENFELRQTKAAYTAVEERIDDEQGRRITYSLVSAVVFVSCVVVIAIGVMRRRRRAESPGAASTRNGGGRKPQGGVHGASRDSGAGKVPWDGADDELTAEVQRMADEAVSARPDKLDYSVGSLKYVNEMVGVSGEVAEKAKALGVGLDNEVDGIVEKFGCYVLEVARRANGGKYRWHTGRSAPVLVIDGPEFQIALLTWDKVRGRLTDPADDVVFLYEGFTERVQAAKPGENVLVV